MHDINLHRHFRVFDVGIDLMLCFDLLNEINIKYPFGYTFLRHVCVFVRFTLFFFLALISRANNTVMATVHALLMNSSRNI